MKHLLSTTLIAAAMALLALARWLDGGSGPGSRRSARSPKSIDLPRSHYRFSHVPPSRWQVLQTGLTILFSSLRFAAGAGV
jgi:hypothetical protein